VASCRGKRFGAVKAPPFYALTSTQNPPHGQPHLWCHDPKRRQKAKVPGKTGLRSKKFLNGSDKHERLPLGAAHQGLKELSGVGGPLLGSRVSGVGRPHRQLQDRGPLAFAQRGQEHDFPVRKFQRVVVGGELLLVDLPGRSPSGG
jgi:hypothetical protein